MSVDLTGFGHQEVVENAASTLTLSHTAHSGIVVNNTVTTTLTLPSVVEGMVFPIRVGASGITVTISPAALDKIGGAGTANAGVGADDKDLIFTNQPAGSYVVLQNAGALGWTVVSALGTFTMEA
jgi:hypothetical protein